MKSDFSCLSIALDVFPVTKLGKTVAQIDVGDKTLVGRWEATFIISHFESYSYLQLKT